MVLLFVPLMDYALLSTLAYSPLLSPDKSFRIVCFRRPSSNAKSFPSYSMFSPSPSCCISLGTMTSADFYTGNKTSQSCLRLVLAFAQISPGKNAIFLSIYLLHLLSYAFGSKDFSLFSNLIQRTLALYEVRVPQTRDLPLASFRFHLTVDTLALSYGYYCLHHSGLEP